MITVNEVGSAVFGAFRLACRDPGGMAFFDRSREGALKSFYAAGILLPFYIFFVVTRWWDDFETLSAVRVFLIESLTYVIAWTIFPVLMIGITKWIDRTDRFFDFVVAYNWASVVAMAVRFPAVVIQRFELLPDPVVDMMILALVIVLVVYGWYVIKTSLDVGGGLAAGLTASEFILGLVLSDVTTAIIEGNG